MEPPRTPPPIDAPQPAPASTNVYAQKQYEADATSPYGLQQYNHSPHSIPAQAPQYPTLQAQAYSPSAQPASGGPLYAPTQPGVFYVVQVGRLNFFQSLVQTGAGFLMHFFLSFRDVVSLLQGFVFSTKPRL